MSKEITSKTKRLAAILSSLENGPVRVPELATRFGVSIRTIQRDMGLFALAKVPVHSPKQSVYEFVQGFSLAATHLSCEQVALLVVSADIAKQIGGSFEGVLGSIAQRFVLPTTPAVPTENPSSVSVESVPTSTEQPTEPVSPSQTPTVEAVSSLPIPHQNPENDLSKS